MLVSIIQIVGYAAVIMVCLPLVEWTVFLVELGIISPVGLGAISVTYAVLAGLFLTFLSNLDRKKE